MGKSRVAKSAQPDEFQHYRILAAELAKPELQPVTLAIKRAASMLVLLDDLDAGEPSAFGRHGHLPQLLAMKSEEITDLITDAARQAASEAMKEALDAFTALCAKVQPIIERCAPASKVVA
jgi:hypothetical protein